MEQQECERMRRFIEIDVSEVYLFSESVLNLATNYNVVELKHFVTAVRPLSRANVYHHERRRQQ
jgi:hypothetical protein